MRKRVTAMTLLLLMLHLTALGSGLSWAASPEVDCGNSQDMTEMAMDMSPDASDAPASRAPDADHFGDCDLPWAFGCTSVAACGATATPVVANAHDVAALPHIAVANAIRLMPTSLATAPELPPPRA